MGEQAPAKRVLLTTNPDDKPGDCPPLEDTRLPEPSPLQVLGAEPASSSPYVTDRLQQSCGADARARETTLNDVIDQSGTHHKSIGRFLTRGRFEHRSTACSVLAGTES